MLLFIDVMVFKHSPDQGGLNPRGSSTRRDVAAESEKGTEDHRREIASIRGFELARERLQLVPDAPGDPLVEASRVVFETKLLRENHTRRNISQPVVLGITIHSRVFHNTLLAGYEVFVQSTYFSTFAVQLLGKSEITSTEIILPD